MCHYQRGVKITGEIKYVGRSQLALEYLSSDALGRYLASHISGLFDTYLYLP
jgi:hypothetical protein